MKILTVGLSIHTTLSRRRCHQLSIRDTSVVPPSRWSQLCCTSIYVCIHLVHTMVVIHLPFHSYFGFAIFSGSRRLLSVVGPQYQFHQNLQAHIARPNLQRKVQIVLDMLESGPDCWQVPMLARQNSTSPIQPAPRYTVDVNLPRQHCASVGHNFAMLKTV